MDCGAVGGGLVLLCNAGPEKSVGKVRSLTYEFFQAMLGYAWISPNHHISPNYMYDISGATVFQI